MYEDLYGGNDQFEDELPETGFTTMAVPYAYKDTLEKLDYAQASLLDDWQNNQIPESVFRAIGQKIEERKRPLIELQVEAERKAKNKATMEALEQSARIQAIAHNDAVFRAQGVGERVAFVADPNTGKAAALYESQPNHWDQVEFPEDTSEESLLEDEAPAGATPAARGRGSFGPSPFGRSNPLERGGDAYRGEPLDAKPVPRTELPAARLTREEMAAALELAKTYAVGPPGPRRDAMVRDNFRRLVQAAITNKQRETDQAARSAEHRRQEEARTDLAQTRNKALAERGFTPQQDVAALERYITRLEKQKEKLESEYKDVPNYLKDDEAILKKALEMREKLKDAILGIGPAKAAKPVAKGIELSTPRPIPEKVEEALPPDQQATLHEFAKLQVRFAGNGQVKPMIDEAVAIYKQYGSTQAMPEDKRQRFLQILQDIKQYRAPLPNFPRALPGAREQVPGIGERILGGSVG